MRLYLTISLLLTLFHTAWADTTNRAKQFSPVPGIFVGGVGLEHSLARSSLAATGRLSGRHVPSAFLAVGAGERQFPAFGSLLLARGGFGARLLGLRLFRR